MFIAHILHKIPSGLDKKWFIIVYKHKFPSGMGTAKYLRKLLDTSKQLYHKKPFPLPHYLTI
jgi:hypothetical protein